MPKNTMKLTPHILKKLATHKRASLTSSTVSPVDLSQYCGSFIDQGTEGCCTACTTRDYTMWLQNKYGYKNPVDPSVNALYYWGRLITGDLSQDGGSTFEDVVAGAMIWGMIPSSLDPLNPSTLYVQPNWKNAVLYPTGYTSYGVSTETLRSLLSTKQVPVAIGVTVTESLMNPTLHNGDYIVDGGTVIPNEGHEILVVAWKEDPTYGYLYKFQNSWGTSWGNNGFAWFSEAYLQQHMIDMGIMDIPHTEETVTPIPPSVTLKVRTTDSNGNEKSTFAPNENFGIGVELEVRGETLLEQYITLVIDGQGNSLPILAPGWNGIPFSTNQIGKHTVVAEWANFVASTTFTIAEPTPQPKPEPKPEPKPNTKTVDTANLNKAISEIETALNTLKSL